jgi:hypothetical protein
VRVPGWLVSRAESWQYSRLSGRFLSSAEIYLRVNLTLSVDSPSFALTKVVSHRCLAEIKTSTRLTEKIWCPYTIYNALIRCVSYSELHMNTEYIYWCRIGIGRVAESYAYTWNFHPADLLFIVHLVHVKQTSYTSPGPVRRGNWGRLCIARLRAVIGRVHAVLQMGLAQ